MPDLVVSERISISLCQKGKIVQTTGSHSRLTCIQILCDQRLELRQTLVIAQPQDFENSLHGCSYSCHRSSFVFDTWRSGFLVPRIVTPSAIP